MFRSKLSPRALPKKKGGGEPHSQAVYNGSPFSFLLTLPLVHLQNQLHEGAFGGGYVSVSRPAQVLELTDHQVAFLRLTSHNSWVITDGISFPERLGCRSTDPGEVADLKQPTDDVTVHRGGYTIHLHVAVTQHSFFWPVLRTALDTSEDISQQQYSVLKTTTSSDTNEVTV